MAEFTRKEDAMYNIPQRFADTNLKKCPLCGEKKPKWLVKEQWKLLGKDYYFKCPACGSILKASQDDVTGLSFTTKTFAGQMKKLRGKENRVIYLTIEKIDLSVKTRENMVLEGEELSLDELMNLGLEE